MRLVDVLLNAGELRHGCTADAALLACPGIAKACDVVGVAMRRMLCLGAKTQPAPLPAGDGGPPQTRSSVSRRSPRLRVVPRRHHEVRSVAAALRAAKPQLGQRHVAAPRLHKRLEVGVRLVAAASCRTPARGRSAVRSVGGEPSGCVTR